MSRLGGGSSMATHAKRTPANGRQARREFAPFELEPVEAGKDSRRYHRRRLGASRVTRAPLRRAMVTRDKRDAPSRLWGQGQRRERAGTGRCSRSHLCARLRGRRGTTSAEGRRRRPSSKGNPCELQCRRRPIPLSLPPSWSARVSPPSAAAGRTVALPRRSPAVQRLSGRRTEGARVPVAWLVQRRSTSSRPPSLDYPAAHSSQFNFMSPFHPS